MKILFALFLIPLLFIPAFAEEKSTEKGTLNVDFSTDPVEPNPNESLKMKIDFINPVENKIQVHIDYTVLVTKDGEVIKTVPYTHTSKGSVTIGVEVKGEGTYNALIGVEGIWFNPIPREEVSFDFAVGDVQTNGEVSIPDWVRNTAGWWSAGQIEDSDFITGIQWLITNGIMIIPETECGSEESSEIPEWIKQTAGWWSAEQIGDSDFVSGIQWLITNGIMPIC